MIFRSGPHGARSSERGRIYIVRTIVNSVVLSDDFLRQLLVKRRVESMDITDIVSIILDNTLLENDKVVPTDFSSLPLGLQPVDGLGVLLPQGCVSRPQPCCHPVGTHLTAGPLRLTGGNVVAVADVVAIG